MEKPLILGLLIAPAAMQLWCLHDLAIAAHAEPAHAQLRAEHRMAPAALMRGIVSIVAKTVKDWSAPRALGCSCLRQATKVSDLPPQLLHVELLMLQLSTLKMGLLIAMFQLSTVNATLLLMLFKFSTVRIV